MAAGRFNSHPQAPQTKRRTEGIRVPVPLSWGGSSTARVRHDDQRLGELQEGREGRGGLQARDSEFPLSKRNQRTEFSHTPPILKVARSSLPTAFSPSTPSFPLFLDCQPPLFLFTLPAATLLPFNSGHLICSPSPKALKPLVLPMPWQQLAGRGREPMD